MIAACVALLVLSVMFLGSGLLAWGIAAQKLDRAKNVRQSAARREKAAILAEESAKRERKEAAWLYEQAKKLEAAPQRPVSRDETIEYAKSLNRHIDWSKN